jgi:class 3 adenylate cyclase
VSGVVETRAGNLDRPDETLTFDHGRVDWVVLGDQTVGRTIADPGWRWSTHIRPLVGGEWCQTRHLGVIVSGTMHIVTDGGEEFELGPNSVIDVAPGHDAWVVGDDPVVSIEWSGVRGWLEPLESLNERVLATIVVTDIVDSTGHANRLGGSRWSDLLTRHNARMRDIVSTFRGREIRTTGDGFLVVFDGAARAVRCATRMVDSAREDGISIRAAVHTGEVEWVGDDVVGVSVHEASRVASAAAEGEVLVTAVTRDLAVGSGLSFEDRGDHVLRGFDGARKLFAVVEARSMLGVPVT